jgi:hypothetical protein
MVNGITGPADVDQLPGAPAVVTSQTGSAVSLQVQSLNRLAGQPAAAYALTGPPGLRIAPGGLISGKLPAAPGAYPVTAAAADPSVAPQVVSFTWRVHGTLSLAPASVATVAGSPVSFQVRATDPDTGAVGYTPPAFRASGLPAGLTISPAGLVTGWPDLPGSYKIAVSATDGLGATGTTTIAWTVKAAPGSGTAGPVRQNGGSGKCLDDPASRTANATAIDLATCTGKPNQTWTAVQDGTVRVLGRCLAASGTHALLYACNSSIGEFWRAGADGALVSLRYGTCLAGPSGPAANGARPALAACTGSPALAAQHWTRPAAPVVSGVAARCLNVSGSAVTISSCGNTSAQRWTIASNGQLPVQSTGACLTAGGTAAGSAVAATKCANATSQHWTLVSAGTVPDEIRATASGLCLTVPAGASASGTKLVLGACSATSLSSTWRVG